LKLSGPVIQIVQAGVFDFQAVLQNTKGKIQTEIFRQTKALVYFPLVKEDLFLDFCSIFIDYSLFKFPVIVPWHVKNAIGIVLIKVIFGIQIKGDGKPIRKIVKVLKKEKGADNMIF